MKTWKRILVIGLIILFSSMFFVGCEPRSDLYTEEEHFERISRRVEKRYMQEGSGYTGYTVYPLYDLNDEVNFYLVDLEPHGFVYIFVSNTSLFLSLITFQSMYFRHSHEGDSWQRYTIEDGEPKYETDENGEYIYYTDSHFKVAGIGDEKRYWLLVSIHHGGSESYRFIPAVKRGDRYLNLVSMEEFDIDSLEYATEDQVVANVQWFYPQKYL